MRELKNQLTNALLVVLTVAAVIAAVTNFRQQSRIRLPDDGITWSTQTVDGKKVVEAIHVSPVGAGHKAGLKPGDIVLSINGASIREDLDVPRVLARLGAWSKAEYVVQRAGIEFKAKVYVSEGIPEPAVYYQYGVGAAWLMLGLFVFVRRGNAPGARHFYILSLLSFILSTFHYTGSLTGFDKIIYWGNVGAGFFAPAVFLHFCVAFPEPSKWLRGRRIWILYVPAILLTCVCLLLGMGSLRTSISLMDVRWLLDRVWLASYCATYGVGGLILAVAHHRAEDTLVRQQLKWLRNGVLLGIGPFALFYAIPYTLGVIPGPWMKMAVLSLPLLPLTWAYAIIRYRLMDVDVIFQQGFAYSLATLAVIGLFYAIVLQMGRFEDLTPTTLVGMILIATFAFQPIRAWIQEQLDRYVFYKDRYDYRLTLLEFARELSSETDVDRLLDSVMDRLKHTLCLPHVACFLRREGSDTFHLARTTRAFDSQTIERMDLSFLEASRTQYLFFERTRHVFDVITEEWPLSVRLTIADLDFTYYVPCIARGRTIAYLGITRTDKGDFLTSDDLDLLQSLAGYLAIAIENARLYQSLERKAEEFERLKEFSENIVESINVGILAADLEDRVESWNSQLERLTGITRADALGRRLCDLLPAELCQRLDQLKGETGVHHIVKIPLRIEPRGALAAAANGQNGHTHSNGNGNGNGNRHGNGNGAARTHAPAAKDAILNLAVAPLVSKDQQQIGRLVIFDDITERSELERQLVQADKLSSIGLLAAGVAHEVNTPLAVISSYAQMLAKQVSGDEAKSKLLEKIARQTFRASEIVNSLLNFSRTSTTEFEEVDLNRLLRETVSLIDHQLTKAGVTTTLELDGALPIRGNSGKLQQVFLNLFLNARDAMGHGGSLRVRAAVDGEVARIEVSDTGQGISPEHLDRIYDPFFTTKGAKKGTGLGLAVTYGIVKEHSGHIEVQSTPGVGTRFLLDFPLARKLEHAEPIAR